MAAAQAVAAVRSMSLMHFLDSLLHVPGAFVSLLEIAAPGSADTLRAWATSAGYEKSERVVTPPGAPAFNVLSVVLPNGTRIAVQWQVVS